ncbi:hypothetical protein [Arthrobacter sp. PsM3]|uniref:hypothetical protein n=1 Tax=Arthrobacter sp. PsM3 TaxID=3030531 RepID=UPI00263B3C5B|nr:hypothetical protein [Arthrobacter sp. PsM3]MDN4645673.1 hypothetical protein [Arthrobacter sp. PsM3]
MAVGLGEEYPHAGGPAFLASVANADLSLGAVAMERSANPAQRLFAVGFCRRRNCEQGKSAGYRSPG